MHETLPFRSQNTVKEELSKALYETERQISVIIGFSGEKRWMIQDLITSLGFNKRIDDQIIITNDSPDPDDTDFLKGLIKHCKDLVITELDSKVVDKEKNNMVLSRNKGVLHTRGNYLVFLDEDMSPSPMLLEEYRKSLDEVELVCGRIEWQQANREMMADFRFGPNAYTKKMPMQANKLANIGQGGGGNFGIRKRLFVDIGGFSEEYNGYWGAEDIDLFRKALEVVPNIYYNYNAYAIHNYHARNTEGNQRNHDIFRKKWLR